MILNITAYRFMTLSEPECERLRENFRLHWSHGEIKGTVLLGKEGINVSVAGSCDAVRSFQQWMRHETPFGSLHYKESRSKSIPFKRLNVRIRKEIVTTGNPGINPANESLSYIAPIEFKRTYQEQRDCVILDVRNRFEVAMGTFQNALELNLKNFSEFSTAIDQLPPDLKNKELLIFCTGGIRCEKAAAILQRKGYPHVRQLEGGILNYFAQCGNDYFKGDCFVFDDRITIHASDMRPVLSPKPTHAP